MNFTNHVVKRYAERILNVPLGEVDKYVSVNRARIEEHLQKMWEQAQFVYKGQFTGDKRDANYYIADDMVLVADLSETAIMTLYRVDWNFPPEITKVVVNGLLDDLRAMNEQLEGINDEYNTFAQEKRHEIAILDDQIKNLNEQLGILQNRRAFVQQEISDKQRDRELLNKKIEQRAGQICYSVELRQDMKRAM